MKPTFRCRRQCGQSLLELICLLPLYVLLLILVVQFTSMYFSVFGDLSEVRNDALIAGKKAETTTIACFEKRGTHSFLLGLTGPTQTEQTKIRLFAYGNGPANCPG